MKVVFRARCLRDNLLDYPGRTNDERVKTMLIEAERLKFNIIPFVDKEEGRKAYSIWKVVDGIEHEAFMPYVDEWIEGFPKA